jgi:hypothetical protein
MLSSWRMYEMHLALSLKAGCDSACGGEAAGEVSGHDRGGKVVSSDRECVAELWP